MFMSTVTTRRLIHARVRGLVVAERTPGTPLVIVLRTGVDRQGVGGTVEGWFRELGTRAKTSNRHLYTSYRN